LQADLRLSDAAFAAYLEISVRMGRCLASEADVCARGKPTRPAAGGRIGARCG